jgi:regulatory protein
MQPDPSFKQALKLSYQLLSYRPRSVFEVKTKLKEKGFDDEIIENTVARLKELRYLNDSEFAKLWVESRMKARPVGSSLLKKDLREKGIEGEAAEKAIEESSVVYNEFDAALKIAERRLGTFGKIHKLKAKKRINDFLIRRGFKFDTVREVLGELF